MNSSSNLFKITPQVKQKKNRLPANPEEGEKKGAVKMGRFPSWLHRPLPKGGKLWTTHDILQKKRLHTVCEEAKCPNLLECFSNKTATFLVLGKECTRACGFCDIDFSKTPQQPDSQEPKNISDSVKALGLQHVVITMVARDDLEDGGVGHLIKILQELTNVTTEVLTSDFNGNQSAWKALLSAKPDIWNYNIETVRSLSNKVRHKATYQRTLELLSYANTRRPKGLYLKSGLMVGLGETTAEVKETLVDLKNVGCDSVTIGQYLQPNKNKLCVKSFITPDQFDEYADFGHSIGIKQVYAGPFVRSSYNAGLIKRRIDNY
jgi:lipoyl synthase